MIDAGRFLKTVFDYQSVKKWGVKKIKKKYQKFWSL
jgi:hypothetical protein